ncbi:MAG: WD40/YVTN/BNR-like repeat-containing protein, partial [Rhabdochlamydiaceae bacterium]
MTNLEVQDLFALGTSVFACTRGGVFVTTDQGKSWEPRNNGLLDTDVYTIVMNDSVLCCGTSGGVYASRDGGLSWFKEGLSTPVTCLIAVGSELLANAAFGSADGTYLSDDNGSTWEQVTSGTRVFALAASGAALIEAQSGGIFFSK